MNGKTTIMKASAGSGKTYNLSKTYLDLLMNSSESNPYRHILAVTFTNKATAEMKNRILKDLAKLAKTDPKAQKLLIAILHDYSALSVSTIDRFFQRTLKAFSREIGQFADYQIELDKTSLINETMDRILDSLNEENKDLLKWISETVSETLEMGDKVNFERPLYDMGKLLKNEDHRILTESLEIEEASQYSKSELKALKNECRKIISNFEKRVSELRNGDSSKNANKRLTFTKTELKKNPELKDYVDDNYSLYNTACIINDTIYSLGLAGEFYKEFDALLKEKNVLCIDESNTILKKIIGGSDAPFVYEKLGVRYENFLLDEFQDTSGVQWDNFLPLLEESSSKGGSNLIVGDVKQSIYRFRGSEWKLLGQEVAKKFPAAKEKILKQNWRSTKTIVEFNNSLFPFLAGKLGLSSIYSDVVQEPTSKLTGCVQLDFTSDQDETIIASINAVRGQGAKWSDIAILVRGNREGSALANKLISLDYPVISDDSLKVKSSLIVGRLTALLKAYDNPKDAINNYLIEELAIELPQVYHSLVDLCEDLLRALKITYPAAYQGETLFIQAFMDELQNWTALNGNNISTFLEAWTKKNDQGFDEKDPSIASPQDANAIRIMTIHKSKGLQFPHVIFPYAEKVTLFKFGQKWCEVKNAGALNGIYPVTLSSKSEDTLFCDAYYTERQAQVIDNINIFYVALTRASKSLHIIAKEPSASFKKSLGGSPNYSDFSQLLYEFIAGVDSIRYGAPFDFSAPSEEKDDEVPPLDFPESYDSIPLAGRLQASTDALEFFSGEEVESFESSARVRGIILHDILSMVNEPSQLESAIAQAIKSGQITEKQGVAAKELLSKRISSHPEWFSSVEVFNERTIIDPSGGEHRPDRVIIKDKEAIIIDFKFGEESPKYLSQVRRYANLYTSLGYKVRDALVWYVPTDSVTRL